MKQPVGVVGLGLLGGAIAERLLQAGLAVVGFDLQAERRGEFAERARVVESAREVFATCPRVLLSLPTSEVVETVVNEVAPAMRPGQILIDTTTGSPAMSAALGLRLAEAGIQYLDATVSGSSAEARRGAVVVMAGGLRETFDACADLFATFATKSFHLGPWGSGARTKLVVNLVLGLNRAALAEGLAFAGRLGLDQAAILEVLQAGAAYSRVMDAKGEKMIRGDFSPQARLEQHLKDTRLILNAGEAAGAKMPLSTLHRELLEVLVVTGLGDLDNSAIIKAFT